MTAWRWVWLALAVLGAAEWIAAHAPYHPFGLIGVWASGQSLDLLIAAVVLTIWVCSEVWVRRNLEALLAIPVVFCVGIGCGLPLFLFLRARPVI